MDEQALRNWAILTQQPTPDTWNVGMLCVRIRRQYRQLFPFAIRHPRFVPPGRRIGRILFCTQRIDRAPCTHEFEETAEDSAILARIIALDPAILGILLENATFITAPDPESTVDLPGEIAMFLEDVSPCERELVSHSSSHL